MAKKAPNRSSEIEQGVLDKLLLFSDSLIKKNYKKRIRTQFNDDILNKIINNLNQHADNLLINKPQTTNSRNFDTDHFIEVISSYSNHDFEEKLKISDDGTILDAIATGINILGEELEQTTISRDYFSNIYNAVSDILVVTDKKGLIRDANLAASKVLITSNEKLIGRTLQKVLKNSFDAKSNLIELFANKINFYPFESEINISGNPILHVSCTLSKIFNLQGNHQGFLLIAKDITEQKNRELKDKRLIIATQEKERKRLSSDLHDSLGQEINAVKIYLSSLSSMDTSTYEYKHALEICKDLLNHSIETIREICFDLMPKSLEIGGLIHACNELVVKLNRVYTIEYNFPNFETNISKENQTILYRIIQEFINNSIKHAICPKIELKISKKKEAIEIFIKDNGKGFNMEKVIKGNGLHNIISRMETLKADYDFKSEIKKGTYLSICFEQDRD